MTHAEIAIAEIRKILKPTITAQIGGFRPPDHLTSQFGGTFRIPPSDWPSFDGKPGFPILQVLVAELPFRPSWCQGTELLQVFFGEAAPLDLPAKNGNQFRVITHAEIPDCDDFAPEEVRDWPRQFPIRWQDVENDVPAWEEMFAHVDEDVLSAAIEEVDGFSFYFDNFSSHDGTKLGGYASYIQGAPQSTADFAFQIASEEKPRFMVGDCGNLYFFLGADGWEMRWDCY